MSQPFHKVNPQIIARESSGDETKRLIKPDAHYLLIVVWMNGRSGDIQIGLENNSAVVGVQVATQRLSAEFDWQLDTKLFSPQGKLRLQIDGLDIKLAMKQSINVQKKPRLEVAQLKLGNIQARSKGAGTIDYVIEFTVNLAFNGFRGVILKAIEKPVTDIIQGELNKLDIEAIIEKKLDEMAAQEDSKNELDSP